MSRVRAMNRVLVPACDSTVEALGELRSSAVRCAQLVAAAAGDVPQELQETIMLASDLFDRFAAGAAYDSDDGEGTLH